MSPPDRLGPTAVRCLALVLSGVRKYRELARLLGRSLNAVQLTLRRLRRAGLVAWDPSRRGTLRPTCTYTPARELEQPT